MDEEGNVRRMRCGHFQQTNQSNNPREKMGILSLLTMPAFWAPTTAHQCSLQVHSSAFCIFAASPLRIRSSRISGSRLSSHLRMCGAGQTQVWDAYGIRELCLAYCLAYCLEWMGRLTQDLHPSCMHARRTHSGIRSAYSRIGSCSSNSTRMPSCSHAVH